MGETRFEEALRLAKENAPEREARLAREAEERLICLAEAGSEGAHKEITRLKAARMHAYLRPSGSPYEWKVAVKAAREAALDAASRRGTITYGELELAAFLATNKLVGHNTFRDLAAAINDKKADGVMLSSVVVKQDTREVGDGFYEYAESLGFSGSPEELRENVWRRFSG